jgi:hypothetical protein
MPTLSLVYVTPPSLAWLPSSLYLAPSSMPTLSLVYVTPPSLAWLPSSLYLAPSSMPTHSLTCVTELAVHRAPNLQGNKTKQHAVTLSAHTVTLSTQ